MCSFAEDLEHEYDTRLSCGIRQLVRHHIGCPIALLPSIVFNVIYLGWIFSVHLPRSLTRETTGITGVIKVSPSAPKPIRHGYMLGVNNHHVISNIT